MTFHKGFRTPVQLTGVARGAFDAEMARFATAALMPAVENFTLDYEFVEGSAPLPAAAKFRSYDTESMVNTTGQGSTRKGKLPPTSIRLRVGEYQQLAMYGREDAIGQKFEEHAIRNAQSVAFRAIMAQAQAIQTGKVTLAERNLAVEIDFGRRAALSATAATPWSTVATSTPLADLEGLRAALGKAVTQTILSRASLNYLQRSTDLIKQILGRGTDLPSRVSAMDVVGYLGSEGFGQVTVDETTLPNTEGVESPLFAADKVILLSGSTVGTTELGVTAEAIDPDTQISGDEQPGLVAGAIATDDPRGFDVLVSAVLLPVLSAPNNTATLDAF